MSCCNPEDFNAVFQTQFLISEGFHFFKKNKEEAEFLKKDSSSYYQHS